jgi:hypothetical protein
LLTTAATRGNQGTPQTTAKGINQKRKTPTGGKKFANQNMMGMFQGPAGQNTVTGASLRDSASQINGSALTGD